MSDPTPVPPTYIPTYSRDIHIPEEYRGLMDILIDAFEQAASGKGKERHANDKEFERQPILEIARMVGTGFTTGQVMKKAQEAHNMFQRGEREKAIREMLGAIVYSAATVLAMKE